MKFYKTHKPLGLMYLFLLILTACSSDDDSVEFNIDVAKASYHEVLFTRISDTEVRDKVYFRMGVTFENASNYSNLGVYKMLFDASGQELSRAIAIENINPDEYTRLIIESGEALFSGLNINQHDFQDGYSFQFVPFGDRGGEPEFFTNTYEFTPDYNLLNFDVSYDSSSSGHVDYTRTSDDIVAGNVNINIVFTINAEAKDAAQYTNVGLMKHLYDADGTLIESAVALNDVVIGEETTFAITSIGDLFEGLTYDYNNNLNDAYTFSFTAFAETENDETVLENTVFETTATFKVRILPTLETGTTWIVTNNNSGFSKEVQLFSVQEELGIASSEYFFTDFGIDWSWWNDFWYGTTFSIDFPEVDGDPYVINLGGTSGDQTLSYTGLADDGVTMETRNLRLMGYTYNDGSPKGEFDEATKTITFTSVNILDWWWGVDSHDNISMTFVKVP